MKRIVGNKAIIIIIVIINFFTLAIILTFSIKYLYYNSNINKQYAESQNGCYKKTKHAKFSEKKRTFLTP